MGARKARLAYAIREGKPVPPPVAPAMFDTETVNLPKAVSALVTTEYNASPYRSKMTRAEYMAKLVESAAGHEANLRAEREAQGSLIVPATHLPPNVAEISKRLEAIKHGTR